MLIRPLRVQDKACRPLHTQTQTIIRRTDTTACTAWSTPPNRTWHTAESGSVGEPRLRPRGRRRDHRGTTWLLMIHRNALTACERSSDGDRSPNQRPRKRRCSIVAYRVDLASSSIDRRRRSSCSCRADAGQAGRFFGQHGRQWKCETAVCTRQALPRQPSYVHTWTFGQ